jgi:uncharacterized membrane protein
MQHVKQNIGDKHPKQDFQVERLAFFSDAVFAIAITLLVIEFKVPHVTKETTMAELMHEVVEMKYKFIALIISFAIISNYWLKHHLLFKHIHNYNKQILVLNLFALFPIILFPFTTAFVYESLMNEKVLIIPFRLFMANNVVACFSMYYLYWQVAVKHTYLSYPINADDKKEFNSSLLFTGISFLLVIALTFIVSFEYSVLGILPIAIIRMKTKYFSKHKKSK